MKLMNLFIALFFFNLIRTEEFCNLRLMRSYFFEGKVTPDNQHFKMCPIITENCCTTEDFLKIHRMAGEKLLPRLEDSEHKMIKLLKKLRKLSRSVLKLRRRRNYAKSQKSFCRRSRNRVSRFPLTKLIKSFKVGIKESFHEHEKIHQAFLCSFCDMNAQKEIIDITNTVPQDAGVCVDVMLRTHTFLKAQNIDLIDFFQRIQRYLDCTFYDTKFDLPFMWENRLVLKQEFKKCLDVVAETPDHESCMSVCKNLGLGNYFPIFEGDHAFIGETITMLNFNIGQIQFKRKNTPFNPLKHLKRINSKRGLDKFFNVPNKRNDTLVNGPNDKLFRNQLYRNRNDQKFVNDLRIYHPNELDAQKYTQLDQELLNRNQEEKTGRRRKKNSSSPGEQPLQQVQSRQMNQVIQQQQNYKLKKVRKLDQHHKIIQTTNNIVDQSNSPSKPIKSSALKNKASGRILKKQADKNRKTNVLKLSPTKLTKNNSSFFEKPTKLENVEQPKNNPQKKQKKAKTSQIKKQLTKPTDKKIKSIAIKKNQKAGLENDSKKLRKPKIKIMQMKTEKVDQISTFENAVKRKTQRKNVLKKSKLTKMGTKKTMKKNKKTRNLGSNIETNMQPLLTQPIQMNQQTFTSDENNLNPIPQNQNQVNAGNQIQSEIKQPSFVSRIKKTKNKHTKKVEEMFRDEEETHNSNLSERILQEKSSGGGSLSPKIMQKYQSLYKSFDLKFNSTSTEISPKILNWFDFATVTRQQIMGQGYNVFLYVETMDFEIDPKELFENEKGEKRVGPENLELDQLLELEWKELIYEAQDELEMSYELKKEIKYFSDDDRSLKKQEPYYTENESFLIIDNKFFNSDVEKIESNETDGTLIFARGISRGQEMLDMVKSLALNEADVTEMTSSTQSNTHKNESKMGNSPNSKEHNKGPTHLV